MPKYRRERFFASAARGKRGGWSNEDWQYALVLAGFILLVYYLAETYKPGEFVDPYKISNPYVAPEEDVLPWI